MKKFFYVGIALFLGLQLIYGQDAKKPFTELSQVLTEMSSYDSLKLSQLPEFKLPEEATRRLLPFAVDNSQYTWFRPLIAQVGLECGQASSIGVVFTYEINYSRNAPGNVPENQYATHFAYNFINGGSDAGVSFYETYEILKYAGNPTVADYGGMGNGGPSRWMNGYDLYYNAMHNRVTEVYSVKVDTPEGLQTIKNWLYDHGNGSSAGGLGCFYSEFVHPPAIFPEGTPEAGKHVIYSWGNSANHAMSIVGYNDSIRWDYNGDGRYSNNIDINLDGIVDMRDWEIGGFKMANTYGSIGGWGDQGFAYMMYKSVADAYQQGGIWNNTIVIIDVRDNYQPQLTAKVSLNYGCRNQLRIMTGVSTDVNATEPEHILHYPIFDFQGGCMPMQGAINNYNLEFGLDLNLLLQYVDPGQPAKYFIIIDEDDPLGAQTGTLQGFSLIDYTNGGNVINSQINELPLIDNSVTLGSIVATVNHNPVQIITDTLPPIQLYNNFSQQLQASQGTPPYRWKVVEDYIRHDSSAVMPVINAVKLQPSSNSNGKAKVELPFSFPFYGHDYTEVYATVDGYLLFENSLLPWPYYIEGRTYFIERPMIAPIMSNPLIVSNSTEGIWYEASGDFVTFRWRLTESNNASTTFNATARLYSDGRIEINYGECSMPDYLERYAGISAGDGMNYEIMTYDRDFSPVLDQFVGFEPVSNHKGINLSEDGILSGQTYSIINNLPLTICAVDKNDLKDYKTYYLTTEGLLMDYEIMAGNDNIIGNGEMVNVTLHITNLNSYPIGSTNLNLSTFDPNYSILTGQANFEGLAVGQTITLENAFLFNVSNNIPNGHEAFFQLAASSNEGNWSRIMNLTAYRPVTSISSVDIIDGNNGYIDPGETVLLEVNIVNSGGAKLTNGSASLSSYDPELTIYLGSATIDSLNAGDIWHMVYGLQLDEGAAINDTLEVALTINGDHDFYYLKVIPLYSGALVEDFETGDFSKFGWNTNGTEPWFAEQGSAYEGQWNARSGALTDNQYSQISLNWNVGYADSISFYYKMSSEQNYDYLHFYTGSQELAKWAGITNWTKATFAVPAGDQIFRWRYEKDYSISSGEDCARLDYIVLPVFAVSTKTEGELPLADKLNIFPNPVKNELNISYSLTKPSSVRLIIIDNNGRFIFDQNQLKVSQIGEHYVKPDLSDLRAGVYSVILVTDSGVVSKKFIRTR
ncbi:MAG: T9SS type A sorting domain-containing protein [Chloroflexota bacterium]